METIRFEETLMVSGLNIMPKIITEIIGPTEQRAVNPNPSVSEFLLFPSVATPVPMAIIKGTLIGPVVTPPESKASGINVSGTKKDSMKTITYKNKSRCDNRILNIILKKAITKNTPTPTPTDKIKVQKFIVFES